MQMGVSVWVCHFICAVACVDVCGVSVCGGQCECGWVSVYGRVTLYVPLPVWMCVECQCVGVSWYVWMDVSLWVWVGVGMGVVVCVDGCGCGCVMVCVGGCVIVGVGVCQYGCHCMCGWM